MSNKPLVLKNTPHLVANRKDLLQALKIVSPVSTRKNTLPVLQMVSIEPYEGKTGVICTDLDTAMCVYIEARGEDQPTIVTHARNLEAAARFMLDDELTLIKDKYLMVRGMFETGDTFDTYLEDQDNFPALPASLINKGFQFQIAAEHLLDMCEHLCYASREETRSLLCGTYFRPWSNNITWAMTDTHRLAANVVPITKIRNEPTDFIVGSSGMFHLHRALKALKPERVVVTPNPDHTRFEWENFFMVCMNRVGDYPKIEKVIPKDDCPTRVKVVVRRTELLNVMRRGLGIRPDITSMAFEVRPKGGTLFFGNHDVEMGRARLTVSELHSEFTGEPEGFQFHLNPYYLLSAAACCKSEHLLIDTQGVLNVIRFRPCKISGEVTGNALYLTMPMNPDPQRLWSGK